MDAHGGEIGEEQLREATLALLEALLSTLGQAREDLSSPAVTPQGTRDCGLAVVMSAADYIRYTMNLLFGPVSSYAEQLVTNRIAQAGPGLAAMGFDVEDLDELGQRAAQLLADIFIAGHLAGPIPPDCWDLNILIASVMSALRDAGELADLSAEADDL